MGGMPMNMYFASGTWGLWYVLLWLTVLPFVIMLLWTVVRVSRATSGEESTWLNGTVLHAFFLLMVTSFGSTLLYVWSQPDRNIWTYVRWTALHFFSWTFLGSSVFFASLQALAAGPKLGIRRLSALLATVGALAIHAVSLYAAYRYRTR